MHCALNAFCTLQAATALCLCVHAGRVEGVLWYFPYENDQETVPLDPHTMGRMLLMANRGLDGAATQNPAAAGGLRAITQLGGPTQLAALQTQRQTQAMGRKQGQAMDQDPPELEAAGKGSRGHGLHNDTVKCSIVRIACLQVSFTAFYAVLQWLWCELVLRVPQANMCSRRET